MGYGRMPNIEDTCAYNIQANEDVSKLFYYSFDYIYSSS